MIGNKNNYAVECVDAHLIKVLTRYLKGQSHKIFCFCFFFMNQFPSQPQSIPYQIFSKILLRYSQVKVHNCRRYQCHLQQIATGINDNG